MKYHELGKIRCAHGIRGEVFLISFSKTFEWIDGLQELRLIHKEQNAAGEWEKVIKTFSIKKKKPHKVGYILDLDGLKTRNQAEELTGAVLEIPETDLTPENKVDYYLLQLKDFTVFDSEKSIGKVIGFSSNGEQDLLVVASDDKKQIEIPNVKPLVANIDFAKQEIICKLPEGFLEI